MATKGDLSKEWFHHVESFGFSSQLGIITLLRIGWINFYDQPLKQSIFVWRRFHHLADIVHLWFQFHDLLKVQNISTLFSNAFYTMRQLVFVELGGYQSISTLNEQLVENRGAYLQWIDKNADMLVESSKLLRILQLLNENPSLFFGSHFTNQMKWYKELSTKLCDYVIWQLQKEDRHLDIYMMNHYKDMSFQSNPHNPYCPSSSPGHLIWPVSFQLAIDLMNLHKRKFSTSSKRRVRSRFSTYPYVTHPRTLCQSRDRKSIEAIILN